MRILHPRPRGNLGALLDCGAPTAPIRKLDQRRTTPAARKAVARDHLRPPRDASASASAVKRAITTAYSFELISEADAIRFIRVFGLEAA